MAKAEAEKACAALPQLGERERRAFLDFADNLGKKLLHAPQMALKKDGGEGVPLVVAVQRLFDLSVALAEPEPEPDAEQPEAAAPAEESKKAAGR
jgi:glutamyl-tRNA reductase